MIKLAEISKEAGFSIPVVSRALSPNPHKDTRMAAGTKKHIREIAKRMGYRPNRNAEFLKRGQNPVIGCFLPSQADSLLAKLMKGIAEEAEKNHFPLAFYFDMTKASYLEFIERSQQSKNCGIITYPYFKMDSEVEAVISDYQKNGGKIILIEGGSALWQWHDCTSVSIDNYHGGRLAAEHLLKQNIKYYITQQYENIPERIGGFIDTIQKAQQAVTITDSLDDLIEKVKTAKKYPTGIYLPRDSDAIAALCAFQHNNIDIGKDVLIIGYDDQYLSQYTRPSLTTVSQPFAEVGRFAIQKLIKDIIYGTPAKSTLIKPSLTVRKSA
jgi:LacI family transcriptional regulator, galactose operon repressor